MKPGRLTTMLFLALLLAACTAPPGTGSGNRRQSEDGSLASSEPRTATLAFRYEKNDLSTKTLTQAGQEYRPLFNAGLAYTDGAGALRPYLAESVPQLNTESWRVFPDGRMETTWRLKPNLT